MSNRLIVKSLKKHPKCAKKKYYKIKMLYIWLKNGKSVRGGIHENTRWEKQYRGIMFDMVC